MNASSNEKKKKKIPVVIVESHQHVCEHIHHVLRQNKLFDQPWTMLHYDAHPDLACPHFNIPAAACFRPRQVWKKQDTSPHTPEQSDDGKNLYELLDSTVSGIAEWILPLVLAANLTRVDWIRPPHQVVEQIPLGEHRYHVGAWLPPTAEKQDATMISSFVDLPPQAIVKVDYDCSYYKDDESVVSREELLLAQPLHLTVSETARPLQQHGSYFALDICLDYFCCRNPFITDVEELDPNVAKAFCQVVYQSTLYSNGLTAEYHRRDSGRVQSFRRLLLDLLNSKSAREQLINTLASDYYHDAQHGKELVCLLYRQFQQSSVDGKRILDLIQQALGNMTMPHQSSSSCNQTEQECWAAFQQGLELTAGICPMLITIARSALDGFTPLDRVQDLQDRVLQLLHECYCGSSECHDLCRLHIIHDYGATEGSTLYEH